MNMMRKLLRGSDGSGEKPPGTDVDYYSPDQELLGLNHLNKLYSEYCKPVNLSSSESREAKLYSMLPLFCKIFNSVPPHVIPEKFQDSLSFTEAVSKLLVTEVRCLNIKTNTHSKARYTHIAHRFFFRVPP